MMLYCRLLGAVLLVCTGFAAGQAYCQRLWAQWRAVCGFERLLTYLADQLAFCALPSAELLAAAAEHPAFAAYCPPNAASFAELRLPPPLAKTCGAELHAGLHTIALCSRQQAPQTMRTLAALCHRTAQGQYAAAQQAAEAGAELGEQRDHGIAQGVDEYHTVLWDFAAGCWGPFCSGPRGEAGDN